MPYIHVKLSCAPSAELSQRVAARLTDLASQTLNKKSGVTAVTVEYLDRTRWFIGAAPLAEGVHSYHLSIQITAGTNSKDEKAAFVARAAALLEQELGETHRASYVVVQEWAADSWGFQGQTQECRYIAGKLG